MTNKQDREGEGLRESVARAISIPEHHTGYELLSEVEKDLLLMQADYAIKAIARTQPPVSELMSKCTSCGEIYPRAPKGHIHKCGRCSGGICEPITIPASEGLVTDAMVEKLNAALVHHVVAWRDGLATLDLRSTIRAALSTAIIKE